MVQIRFPIASRVRLAGALAAAVAVAFTLVLSTMVAAPSGHAQQRGFSISDGRLLDANGNPFVMRGVSHPHVWYQQHTGAFADIKSLGANSVRVVLGSGQRWGPSSAADVSNVVSLCKQNRLICVLEVHDTTGYGEEAAAATLEQAVDYWISVRDALVGQEAYVLINIGNEPYGNNQDVNVNWASDTSRAINRLRDAGFDHTLVVDAPNWGQDWRFLMRDNAASVFDSDPQANTMFSIHMYGVFDTAAEVSSYLEAFQTARLPLMVGEFGHNHSDGDPDEDTIMSQAQQRGIGYIGWSWSGNSGGAEYLDMVTGFDVNRLTSWGERIFNGANGIADTAEEATVYDDPPTTTPTTTPPTTTTTTTTTTTPPTTTPPDSSCRVDYVVRDQWNTGFTADVTITNLGPPITGWTLGFGFPGDQQVTNGWSASWSQSGQQVTATNASWNGNLATGASATIGFNGSYSGSNAEPATFTVNGATCGPP